MHGGPNGPGMSGTVIGAADANPVLTGLRATPRRVARRKKVKVRFALSESARVFGGLDPVGGSASRRGQDISRNGNSGTNTFRIRARGLDPGLYKLTLAAEDEDGNESDPSTTYFRVKRAGRWAYVQWLCGRCRGADNRRAGSQGGDDGAQRARLPLARAAAGA